MEKNTDKVYTNRKGLRIIKRFVKKNLNLKRFSEIIDPSAGNSQLKKVLPITEEYDLYPENDDIICADFLTVDLIKDNSRLIITSPPFMDDYGKRFLVHCSKYSNFIVCILSKKVDHENFIPNFELKDSIIFKGRCFVKNGKKIELNHHLCLYVKDIDYI